MSSLVVRPARRRAEVRAFVGLPWTLYAPDPMWVPPLKSSVREILDPKRHPFYGGGAGAERELFVAWDGPDPVGRVAAIVNHEHDRFHDERVGFFGFFECIERPDVARRLLAAAEEWVRGRGATAILGPMNPSTNYECGLLVEGFNRPPVVMMTYNPPYYRRLIERAGYSKVKDLHAYISSVHDGGLERISRLARRGLQRNPGLTTRPVDLSSFAAEVRRVQEIYNAAWEGNWGFVPMSDGEIEWLARELKPLVLPGLLRFAEDDGEPVGFMLCLPDWNPVLKDLDGDPWRHPLRTLHHALRTRAEHMEGLRMITLGVKASHRKRGIEAMLIADGLRVALDVGYKWSEYSWILEDNELIKGTIGIMDGELYKVYRIFSKPLT